MHGYTKLFESILTSTIWDETEQTRIVWITMLALKNQNHIVEASLPGLARMARVSIDATKEALEKFLAPDQHSRSQEFGGRRIEAVDGGWRILNGAKYDGKMKIEERREYMRTYMQNYTPPAKRQAGETPNNHRFQPPTPDEAQAYAVEINLPDGERLKFLDFYTSKGWKVGKAPMKDWKAAMRNWKRTTEDYGHGTAKPGYDAQGRKLSEYDGKPLRYSPNI